MALMTEERRKEMEEEMSRFELEIAAPGGAKPSSNSNDGLIGNKPLSPPPPPPAVPVLIPEALVKAPPPPPPSSPPPSLQAVLRPPPPPPPVIQARPQTGPIRFIPHQLHRHPPRPMRPDFGPMRGLPMGGPGPFPGPFGPPMGQAPSQMPGSHMPHMPPGPMPMPPMPPHQMGNMSLPMPPGFCPPSGPVHRMSSGGGHPCDAQSFMGGDGTHNFETGGSGGAVSSSESASVVAAPAVYAAPFVKSHSESVSDSPSLMSSTNGQENTPASAGVLIASKSEKQLPAKTEEQTVGPTVPSVASNEETAVSKKKEKKKKIIRMAGGQAWEDNSLLDWDTDDFRIFCGDLGNDVTDEVLIRAFSKYPSFVKAKVIRDKRTNKTKGYGFVSFKDPQDFIKAMREMNGKYVGSRPIKLRKSTWRDRNIDLVKKKQREKEKLGLL